MATGPRILITGFGPFPGAPVNPTAAMIEALAADPAALDGAIYHTYSAYSRSLDMLNPAYQMLDIVPKGRDEDALSYPMEWVPPARRISGSVASVPYRQWSTNSRTSVCPTVPTIKTPPSLVQPPFSLTDRKTARTPASHS